MPDTEYHVLVTKDGQRYAKAWISETGVIDDGNLVRLLSSVLAKLEGGETYTGSIYSNDEWMSIAIKNQDTGRLWDLNRGYPLVKGVPLGIEFLPIVKDFMRQWQKEGLLDEWEVVTKNQSFI